MKVIHINSSDINGGAARAAFIILKSLLDNENRFNIKSIMRVIEKESDDLTVIVGALLNKSK